MVHAGTAACAGDGDGCGHFVGYISLNGYVSSGLLLEIQNNRNVFLVEPVISDSKNNKVLQILSQAFQKIMPGN